MRPPLQDAVHYAFFAPYTLSQHLALVSEMQSRDGVRLRLLGETLDGHDIDQLQIGGLQNPDLIPDPGPLNGHLPL